jgi:hypothetical protein
MAGSAARSASSAGAPAPLALAKAVSRNGVMSSASSCCVLPWNAFMSLALTAVTWFSMSRVMRPARSPLA